MLVVCQVIDNDLNFLGVCVGEGEDLWTAMSAAQEQFVMRRSPNDPALPPVPVPGSSPVTAPLFRHQNGGIQHNGTSAAVMDPPRPDRPAYSADGLTFFDQDGPKCARHKIGKPSEHKDKKGTWFCPKKEGGEFCEWVYPPRARA